PGRLIMRKPCPDANAFASTTYIASSWKTPTGHGVIVKTATARTTAPITSGTTRSAALLDQANRVVAGATSVATSPTTVIASPERRWRPREAAHARAARAAVALKESAL